jgi:hypothetical protein
VLCIASCKALIRLKVQRLVFVRPSAQSDPDIPAARAFAAALKYSLFVRNICYSAEL